jgi:hypothetical protein
MMGLPKVSEKSTKKEILAAFNAARKQNKERELGASETKLAKVRNIKESFKAVSVDSIVTSLSGAKTFVSTGLAEIEQKMISSLEQLHKINEAIDLANKELQETHEIKASADTILALEITRQELKLNFEATHNEAKKQWAQEQKDHDATLQREHDKTALERKQKEETWKYNYQRHCVIKQDEAADKIKGLHKENLIRTEDIEADIRQRKLVLETAEDELKLLRILEKEQPGKIQAACIQAVDKALRSEKTSRQFEVMTLKKETETEKKFYIAQIANLEDRLGAVSIENQDLRKQVDLATDKVQVIATEAVRAAKPNIVGQPVQQAK